MTGKGYQSGCFSAQSKTHPTLNHQSLRLYSTRRSPLSRALPPILWPQSNGHARLQREYDQFPSQTQCGLPRIFLELPPSHMPSILESPEGQRRPPHTPPVSFPPFQFSIPPTSPPKPFSGCSCVSTSPRRPPCYGSSEQCGGSSPRSHRPCYWGRQWRCRAGRRWEPPALLGVPGCCCLFLRGDRTAEGASAQRKGQRRPPTKERMGRRLGGEVGHLTTRGK